jgi:HK97 family phage major capsid protein
MSEEIKDVIDNLSKGFEEFKAEQKKNIDEVKKNGVADPLLQEKVNKMAEDVAVAVEQKQTIELHEKALEEANAKLEKLETTLARPETGKTAKEVDVEMKAFSNYLRTGDKPALEQKALYESDDSLGGYYCPTEYVADLIKGVTEFSPMRSIVRVRSTDKRGIEVPKRTGQFSASWVSENATRSETTGYTTGLMSIDAHECYALVDVSQAMLEDSAFNMESELATEFAEQFAVLEGNSVVAGDGIGKPLGLTDSTAGVSSTNSGHGTTLTANGLLDLTYAIKTDYMRNARFLMNRGTFAKVLQLEDTEGQKIFHVGMTLVAGAPSTILGHPYTIAKDMPDVGAGAKPVAFGDFSRAYTLVDRTSMSINRDPYTVATSGRVRYIARRRVGGTVVLPEAIQLQNISA